MKKLILITSCVAMFGVASYAQDTTKTKSTQQPTEQTPRQSSDEMRNTQKGNMKGWNRVESTEVPENLKTTLSGSQYTGWENGTIYRNEAGDMYQLKTSGNSPKTYYFDKNGKTATKPNHN